MGGFIGVNYAASKLPWTSSLQVSCTLALISAGLWFLFDRTFHGFLISLTVAFMGTIVAYFLVLNGWYRYVLPMMFCYTWGARYTTWYFSHGQVPWKITQRTKWTVYLTVLLTVDAVDDDSFTRADFFGVGSWMPCILYSSSVCFGSIGRQLDVVPETWFQWNEAKAHAKSE